MSTPVPELDAFGPYFALHRHTAAPGDGWEPLRADAFTPRVHAARAYLAAAAPPEAIELRVAASVTHLGLAARLLSPAFALAVLTPETAAAPLPLDALRWQPTPAGPGFPLSYPADHPAPLTALLAEDDGAIPQLAAHFADFGVAAQILRGNAASALGGAATVLTRARPDLAPRARAVLATALTLPHLRDTATPLPGNRLRRRTCCLIYRASPDRRPHPAALCGDCVLAARA